MGQTQPETLERKLEDLQNMRAGGRRDLERGRDAERPSHIPRRGWHDILWRVWLQLFEDRVMLVAAGSTFYLLLALFPALAAFVAIFSLISDPSRIADQIGQAQGLLPSGGIDIIQSQLKSLANQSRNVASFGFIFALLVAFWSANSGIKTIFEALNIAYGEREKRSFIRLNAQSFLFTLGAMLLAMMLIIAVGVVPAVLAFVHLGELSQVVIRWSRWPVIFVVVAVDLTIVYSYGPSRHRAKWRWISWGAVIATAVWIGMSFAFSYYLQNFANYNATYGSLGAAIGFLLWLWISIIILIIGAELDAEMEHQTARDSTIGEPRPMGERGAYVADTLGKPVDASSSGGERPAATHDERNASRKPGKDAG